VKKELGQKKHSKKWIIPVIILVIILGLGLLANNARKKINTALETISQADNATVSTMTLTKSVGATGTIKSINKKDITVSLTGAKINAVNVSIGDEVKAGDLLLSFDSSDIEDKLAYAKESLENAEKQSEISSSSASRSYSDTKRSVDYSIDTAKTQLDSAEKSYNETVKDLDSAKEQLKYYEKMRDLYKINISNGEVSLKTAKEEETAANTAYTAAVTAFTAYTAANPAAVAGDAGYDAVKSDLDTCQAAYNAAQAKTISLENQQTLFQTDYQKYYNECITWESKVNSYEASVDSLKSTYEAQLKAYNNTVASQNSALQSAKSSLESSKISQSTATDTYTTQVENYEEQLENCSVYAPFSGIVTAVNYEEGSTYSGGALITIQDCSEYIIETEISEYEISDISVGQSVLIKTNATGETVMNGKVTFVSPVSGQSTAMSSGSTPSYTVKISIEDASDRLRLDMSASLSIIIEKHENVMVVPYNAVGTDENGRTFVTRYINNQTENIYVDVVMESNYYTEISSSELKDGDEIVIIDRSNDNDLYSMMMGGRGDF